jgi:hypothetical protein
MINLVALAATATLTTASPINSAGPNTVGTAQNVDGFFSLDAIATVTNSTTLPHVEITRAAGPGGFDWYTFSHTGGQVILDIDGPLTSFDTEVSIWDAAGTLLGNNDDNGGDPGSNSILNSFLSLNLPAGNYFVAVSQFPSSQSSGFVVTGPIGQGGAYNLNISANSIVPEPLSVAVFGGLMAVGGLVARRRKA